jgi:hypothetical protein
MTKSQHKLTLRKETLRTLNTRQLARVVVGGAGTEEVAVGLSKHTDCPLQSDIGLPNK